MKLGEPRVGRAANPPAAPSAKPRVESSNPRECLLAVNLTCPGGSRRIFAVMTRPLKLKCPACRKEGEWFATAFGPFCSKRCKLIDLGKWFSEEQKISEPLRPEALEEFADLPPGKHLDEPERDGG